MLMLLNYRMRMHVQLHADRRTHTLSTYGEISMTPAGYLKLENCLLFTIIQGSERNVCMFIVMDYTTRQ